MAQEHRELAEVRKRLDSLNVLRLSGPLGAEALQLYQELCSREAHLLQKLARDDLTAVGGN